MRDEDKAEKKFDAYLAFEKENPEDAEFMRFLSNIAQQADLQKHLEISVRTRESKSKNSATSRIR